MKRKAKRLAEIAEALACGMSYGQVQVKFTTKYKLSDRQIRADITAVRTQWAKEAEAEGKQDIRRNQTRQLLRSIANKAIRAKKFTAAVAAANRLMELDGLKVIKVEHSGKVEHGVPEMTSADKRTRLAELLSLAQQRKELAIERVRLRKAKSAEKGKATVAKNRMDASKGAIEERATARKEARKN